MRVHGSRKLTFYLKCNIYFSKPKQKGDFIDNKKHGKGTFKYKVNLKRIFFLLARILYTYCFIF